MRPRVLAGGFLLALGLAAPALAGPPATVLLVPDSFRENLWAFDPFDGSLISNNYVPNTGIMSQTICALGTPQGTIIATDELLDRVIEMSTSGQLLRVLMGPEDGLDGPFGMALHEGAAYVCSPSQQRIWKIDLATRASSVWWNAKGIAAPRDIVFRAHDALVTDSAGDDIERLSHQGEWLGTWVDSDGVIAFDFPQQIQLLDNGDVILAAFSDPRGLWRYDGDFAFLISVVTPTFTSPRGVYELGNGEWLYTGGTRVMAVNPNTLIERTIVNDLGSSFRFVNVFTPGVTPPCPADLDGSGSVSGGDLAILLGAWGTPGADLDGNGTTDAADLAAMLGAWGPCPS